MHGADRDEHDQHGHRGNSGQPNPSPSARAGPGLPAKRSENLDRRRDLPGDHVERSADFVWVSVDRRECPIEFDTNSRPWPIGNAGDFSEGDPLQAAEHHDHALQFRQLVVRGDDGAEFIRYAINALSRDRVGRLGTAQKCMYRQLT
jgi:hypothetical protein